MTFFNSGNDHYLFRSAYFWFAILLVVTLCLLPRYIYKAYTFAFHPSDMDLARWILKQDPSHDFSLDKDGGLTRLRRPPTRKEIKRNSRSLSLRERPPAFRASRTDMATGLRSVSRGFDFATEENGVAMQRMQSHLSDRHVQIAPEKQRRRRNPSALMQSFSISRSIRKKRRPSEGSSSHQHSLPGDEHTLPPASPPRTPPAHRS